jgi:flagellum-specific peptidoglycan hydrolase FlgJ
LQRASKPWWQQATALVSLSAGGAITGFSFVPKAIVDFSSPTSLPVNLLALQHTVRQAPAGDATLRTAIVNVAQHYLQLAQDKTPAEVEAMIWQQDSVDHADHGPSCAAFASLTLELAAKVVGQQSWVTGGSSYPWPLHTWADVRVDPNPASPGITSILQDAQAHGRWHPLGAGYQPQPGDWVLFNEHVEVVTDFAHGVLHTIGGDSLPNFSVNAHTYPDPLSGQGVVGFVNNGSLASPASPAAPSTSTPHGGHARSHGAAGQDDAGAAAGQAAIPGSAPASAATSQPAGHRAHSAGRGHAQADATLTGLAAIPGSDPGQAAQPASTHHAHHQTAASGAAPGGAAIPGATIPGSTVASSQDAPHHHRHRHGGRGGGGGSGGAAQLTSAPGGAAIPGVPAPGGHASAGRGSASAGSGHHQPPASTAPVDEAAAQKAFIDAVAPGAIASQHAYGVPAAVTIAQAIEESNWGQSQLSSQDHNLFGMKGTGPAGSTTLPTQEFQGGQWVSTSAAFRVYHNFAESIADHGQLLAGSGYYQQAMAVRGAPNAFANALTGVYATDPSYGSKLISLMRQYNLYQYDAGVPQAGSTAAPTHTSSPAPSHSTPPAPTPSASRTGPPAPAPTGTATPTPSSTPTRTATPTPSAPGTGIPAPAPPASSSATAAPTPAPSTGPSATHTSAPSPAPSPTGHTGPSGTTAGTVPGQATIPGVPDAVTARPAAGSPAQPSARAVTRADRTSRAHGSAAQVAPETAVLTAKRVPLRASRPAHAGSTRAASSRPASNRRTWTTLRRYRPEIPASVQTAFLTTAKVPLRRDEPLYREVGTHADIPWKLLAAADWMQCEARSGYSPVHGEKLGTINPDGTSYATRSAALEQCADDLRDLSWSVYQIDLTERRPLSVTDLASVFAAFRWGRLLVVHRTSALEFPYSVGGLTVQHLNMRWPKIAEPDAPDKPGTRFRRPFGAVPIVLGLGYPAVV